MIRAVACAALLAAALAAPARADDRQLLRAVNDALPRVEAVAGVQARYEAARDLEFRLDRSVPVSDRCLPLWRTALAYAHGWLEIANGIDRARPALYAAGDRRVAQAQRRLRAVQRACRPARPGPSTRLPQLSDPRSFAVSFGAVVAPFPATELRANGRVVARSRTGRFRVTLAPGRYDLEARGPSGRRARSVDVWLLPRSAERLRPARAEDQALRARLAELGRSFGGYSAFSVRDLATGRTAGWNADARFPAASTAKLGVLVATLRWLGAGPRILPELQALAGWSSNLAANRLVPLLGGDERVAAALRGLGARSTTYPGPYRVGTGRGDVVRQPPLVSLRVTTAGDLTRALATLHAAAIGNGAAQARAHLTREQARLALGLLLSSDRSGDNVGLLRRAVPGVPMAQKQGWISSARHTTAIVYGPRGPVVVTVLTYRPGLTLAAGQQLGSALTRLLDLG